MSAWFLKRSLRRGLSKLTYFGRGLSVIAVDFD